MRLRILLVLIALLAANASWAATLTPNGHPVAGTAPSLSNIPRDYAINSAPINTIHVGLPLHFAYQVDVLLSDTNPVTIAITTPPSFVTTSIGCVKFPNGGTIGSGSICTTSINAGPMNATDQIVVVVDGYFKQAGSAATIFQVARGSESLPAINMSMTAYMTQLPVDLAVTKEVKPKTSGAFGPAASIAFGATVTYKIVVTNTATPASDHHTDLYLGPLLNIRDTVSTPSTNDVFVSFSPASSITCAPSGGAVCPTTGSLASGNLWANNSQPLVTIGYLSTSNGLLPAGASFEIMFDLTISTNALCSPGQNNSLKNTVDLTYSNSSNTISDMIASNNTASATVTLTGLPVTCPVKPTLGVTKTLLSPAAWGALMRYRITFTNTTGATLTGMTLSDMVTSIGAPPFTATIATSSIVCTPACNSVTNNTPMWVPSQAIVFTASLAPLANNAMQKVEYEIRYDTPCSIKGGGGTIRNTAMLGGPAQGSMSVDAAMPDRPLCDLSVRKIATGPTAVTSFPTTLTWNVVFTNHSPTQTVKVGTLADAIAYESPGFAHHIDATYSYSCTPTGVTTPTGIPLSKTNGTAQIQYNNPVASGVLLFDFSSVTGSTFAPGGTLACTVSVTLKQPPADDSKCQGIDPKNIVNTGLMNLTPWVYKDAAYQAPVATPLPKCVSLLVGKTTTDATPGSTVTFTLTIKNPANDPETNVVVSDVVPPVFTNVSWSCPTGCTTTSGTGNNISIPLNAINPGDTVTITITATAPQILGSYCNKDEAHFVPFPANTFFEGDEATLTTATACVQVKPPSTGGKPKLTKTFDPNAIGSNGTSVLIFTITNATGDPVQNGIAFTDMLPAGLEYVLAVNNTCGGTASISTDHKKFSYSGGHLNAGQHTCTISVKVKATGTCGTFRNDKSNFSEVSNLDVSGASAQLEVKGCEGGLIVSKKVDGAPSGFSGQFPFLVQCVMPGGGFYSKEVTVTYPAPGFVSLTDVPAGSKCTVTEGQVPAAPAGYNWDGLPAYTPDGGVIVTTDKGGQVTAINTLKPCVEMGQVRITKILKGVPSGFTGSFNGTLQCWVGGNLQTFPVTLVAPGNLVVTVNNIPLGSTCTFAETSQSPLPPGMQWNPPLYSPKFGNVTLTGLCCQDVTVTNEARKCCEKKDKEYGEQ